MIPENDDAHSDDLRNEDDRSELTDGELEEFASVLIEALTFPPQQATGDPPVPSRHAFGHDGGRACVFPPRPVLGGIDTRQ